MPKARGRQPHPSSNTSLFGPAARTSAGQDVARPLADRMRPRTLDELVGQGHLVGEGRLLGKAIADGRIPSMILWGPPGSGKTTIARIVADSAGSATFVPFSAVLGGVPELRVILHEAEERQSLEGRRTILFIDEIHRFNKAQQDAFLPHVEHGTITMIGATTENPSFAVNSALLSRCKVFHLEALSEHDLALLLQRALDDEARGLGRDGLSATGEALLAMASAARGDARRALSTLEMAAAHVRAAARREITLADLLAASEDTTLLYDKKGEEHYNVTSAFIKSLRGSDPDAAIYYMMRMVDAGDDPLFILRRMLIFASEDIGNADPRALMVTVAADEAFRRMGMPEGLYPMSHACLYLASAPKSNAVKNAWMEARRAIAERGALPVPKKLRNAVTPLMKQEAYGTGYRYAHDYEGHVVPGETYLPDAIADAKFYEPSDEGLEKAIKERLARQRAAKA
jgi:putative ATPase